MTKKLFFCLFAVMFAGTTFADGFDAAELPSVLKQDAPVAGVSVPAVTVTTVSVPSVAPAAAPCVNCTQPPAGVVCVNGQCGTRLYSVQNEQHEQHRNRLFGGHVVRKSQRTVVKPVRR